MAQSRGDAVQPVEVVHAEERFACCRVRERRVLIHQPFRTAAGVLTDGFHGNSL
jgi:hypothetical protein